jgi:hypothetical protein
MFWLLLISPFIFLGLAALIAKKPILIRSALALVLVLLLIDVIAFWDLVSEPRTSTGSIGLGVLNLIQVAVGFVVLILSIFARKTQQTSRD